MRTRIGIAVAALALLLGACSQSDPTKSEEYKELELRNLEIVDQSGAKDSTINEMFGAFNRISENLRTIREKQGLIGQGGRDVEQGRTMEEGIAADLREIDSLIEANKRIIAGMKQSAATDNKQLTELRKAISEFERTISEKDQEIAGIKEELASTNASLASMIRMYQDKEQQADMQRAELNTAWYCVGTQKELRDNNILTKEGGVIGIGSVDKLKTTDLNTAYFNEIDITEVTTIPFEAKKAKLVTSHPAGSYELIGEGPITGLSITKPNDFWSVSKYLVVQVD